MIGLSAAWNGGNVGPVASEISAQFDVSLGVVGLLSGTLFLGSTVVGLLFAAQIGNRIGLLPGLRVACLLLVTGNLMCAISPVFIGLAIGRLLPGLGFALANTLGAVWARDSGGIRLIGIFGASIQFGIALALLVGSLLSDLDVNWRVGFFISAGLAVITYLMIPGHDGPAPAARERGSGFVLAALRHARTYRLALLFISIYGVPLILSAWLIEYLSEDGSVATAVAGVIAFVLFGLSAGVRVLGAQLKQRGLPHALLCGSLALASIGIAAIALDPATTVAFGAVVLLAVGFGVPYATALTEAQDLYPPAPSEPVALMTFAALVPPIIVIPILGHAIDNGDGDLGFAVLAGFVVIAALANLKRTGISLTGSTVR